MLTTKVSHLVLLAILFFAASVDARDIFVNNLTGDDRNSGALAEATTAENGPTLTIARAVRLAKYTDRIVIENTGEPYRECITLFGESNSGSSYNPFIIEGNGAIVDGTGEVPVDAWKAGVANAFMFSPPTKSFQQLFVDGTPAARRAVSQQSELATLQPLQWARLNRNLYFFTEPGKSPSEYDLRYSVHPVGISLYKVEHVWVRNLVVQGFRIDGINLHDNCFECEIDSVTARGNGRSGISVGGASRVKLNSCVVGDNGQGQIRTEGWSTTEIVNSELIENTGPKWIIEGGKLSVDGERIKRTQDPEVYSRSPPLHRP